MGKKLDSYNFTCVHLINGKIVTEEELIQHIIDRQKDKQDKSK